MTGPRQILDELGAVWSPDFDAYASGKLPISQVRCVLCGHAPCTCRQCEVIYGNPYHLTFRPPTEVCGMTIQPNGECPRGHRPGDPADI